MVAGRGRRAAWHKKQGMSVGEAPGESKTTSRLSDLPAPSQITAPREGHARGWVRAIPARVGIFSFALGE